MLTADDYVTDRGHHPELVQSLTSTKHLFSFAPFSSVTRSRSFLEITARQDLHQNAMTDPDDPAISRICEAQTFVTVHTTVRHYLLSIQSTSCRSISRSTNLMSTLLHLFLPNCLSCLRLFRSQTCMIDARRSLCCKIQLSFF